MVINTFLKNIAHEIINEHECLLENNCIVLPSKRACIALKNEIQNLLNSTNIAPNIFTIDEFLNILHTNTKASIYQQQVALYKSIRHHIPSICEDYSLHNFWISSINDILKDFEEICGYIPYDKVQDFFVYVQQFKELIFFNKGKNELTSYQLKYLKRWELLHDIYITYNDEMCKNNIGSQEQIISEIINENKVENNINVYEKIYFIGLNALSNHLKLLITKVSQHTPTKIILDYDDYYTKNKIHGAGYFIRENVEYFNLNLSPKTDFKNQKYFHQHQFNTNSSLSSQLPNIILKLIKENNITKYNEITIILNDEQAIVPLCYNTLPILDKNNIPYNISIGYPLTQSILFDFIYGLYLIFQDKANDPTLAKWINNFYTKQIFKSDTLDEIVKKINPSHSFFGPSIYILLKSILEHTSKLNVYEQASIELVIEFYLKNNFHKSSSNKNLDSLIWETFRTIKIPFVGVSNNAIQIMGILETRCLSSPYVIMLHANETHIPTTQQHQTFIPAELRKAFEMLNVGDNQFIQQYYFYRLIQYAKEVHFLYLSQGSDLHISEKSRFILQLENELPFFAGNNFKNEVYNEKINFHFPKHDFISIDKTDDLNKNIIQFIQQKSFSASSIQKLIACPLQFYYTYIVGIKDESLPNNNYDHAAFGQLIHKVLQEIYTNTSILQSKNISELDIDSILTFHFAKYFLDKDPSRGEGILIIERAKHYITSQLLYDLQLTEKKELKNITAQEYEIKAYITSATFPLSLYGIIDRVDEYAETVAILDYKTSKKANNSLTCKSISELELSTKNKYQIQLLFYLLLAKNSEQSIFKNKEIKAGIYFLPESEKLEWLTNNKKTITQTDDIIKEFEKYIASKIEDFANPNKAINQTTIVEHCQFCAFKEICKR